MKKTLFLMLIFAFAVSVSAQNEGRRERQNNMSLAEMYNRQASRLAKQLKLEDEAEQKFMALYLDYQNARHNVANPSGGDQEGVEQRTDFRNLSDEAATELIQNNFDRQEKQLAVDREYLPKFLEILTPVQAAQVYLQRGGGNRPGGQQQGGPRGGVGRGNGPRGGFGGGFGGGF